MAATGEPKDKRSRASIQFGYWKIRGLAQPIRLLLTYVGAEFDETRYEAYDVWAADKYSLGLDFPNLPYYIEGDVKITQSNAILRYLARKHSLYGGTDAEKTTIDVLECEAFDFRNGFVRLCYNSDFESMKDDYLKNVPAKIKNFATFLGDKQWFTGSEITYVDFILYELLDLHRLFEPTLLDDHANIKAFLDRFEALPAIQEYMKSDQFIKRPVNGEKAQWK